MLLLALVKSFVVFLELRFLFHLSLLSVVQLFSSSEMLLVINLHYFGYISIFLSLCGFNFTQSSYVILSYYIQRSCHSVFWKRLCSQCISRDCSFYISNVVEKCDICAVMVKILRNFLTSPTERQWYYV